MKADMSPAVFSAAAVLLLAGCAGGAPERGPETSRRATQVFVGNCLTVTGLESALFTTLASSLISQGYNRIGTTLEASAAEQTWTVTGATNFEASKASQPRCVQVVQGQFFQETQQATGTWAADTPYASYVEQLKTRGILLAARPDFFFEGVFRTSANGAARAIVPAALGFHEPIGKRPLRRDDGRRTKLRFVFHDAANSATDAGNAATELDFGMLWPGTLTKFEVGCARGTGSSTAPPAGTPGPVASLPPQPADGPPAQPVAQGPATAPVPAPAQQPSRACSTESLWFRTTAAEAFAPISLTVTVSQVQDRSDALGFIADVFTSSKTELERITKEELIESEREKAKLAALAARTTLATNYTTAATAALQALDACSTAGTLANRSAARLKQMEANLAAAQAGVPGPFADADMPALAATEQQAKDVCARAISNFR